MEQRGRLLLAAVVMVAIPLGIRAQLPPSPPISIDAPPLGGAITIPLPSEREKELKKYEIPELAGTQPVTGSYLINGTLPHALIDFNLRYPGLHQRITLYESGLAAIRVEGKEGTIQKRLVLPADAFATYRLFLDPDELATVTSKLMTGQSPGQGSIRIRRGNGSVVERSFDPSLILPEAIEQQRMVLQDLMRAIAEDRDVTNPMSVYKPRIGDRLVSDDKKSYRVNGIFNGGQIIELTCLGQPTRMYVSSADLHNLFIGARKPSPD